VAAAPCVDRRKFAFKLRRPRGTRVVRALVYVNGKLVVRKRGRNLTGVTLNRLPRSRFTVQIVTTRSNGRKIRSVRTYRGCEKSKPQTRRG
jgi:hypothetical protein